MNYYPMDIEPLFSRQPFLEDATGRFDMIRPQVSQTVPLPETGAATLEIPESLQRRNMRIEAMAGGAVASRAIIASDLSVQVIPSLGEVRVTRAGSGAVLPGTYVKVYARMSTGEVRFYKDGYTDLRGRFDYAALSTDDLDRVVRFALLILNDDHGAVVRETAPPGR